jgi:hypothetical protein
MMRWGVPTSLVKPGSLHLRALHTARRVMSTPPVTQLAEITGVICNTPSEQHKHGAKGLLASTTRLKDRARPRKSRVRVMGSPTEEVSLVFAAGDRCRIVRDEVKLQPRKPSGWVQSFPTERGTTMGRSHSHRKVGPPHRAVKARARTRKSNWLTRTTGSLSKSGVNGLVSPLPARGVDGPMAGERGVHGPAQTPPAPPRERVGGGAASSVALPSARPQPASQRKDAEK